MKLIEQQGFSCGLTGRKLTPASANVDHIIPVVRGGLHEMNNLVVLHSDVNRAKGTMDMGNFISMCCAVAQHVSQELGVDVEELATEWSTGS